ncbi:hypothetical protein CEP52_011575 [Fusarium oligoseptatum]|uniref:Uncharacterized protein n=1 Tax=Fusarium oligoseptatum TaxID=2604345 RepID=A0A428T2I3_9HYPO|nr:hypothetical protein CEP52_011575 [Fusarium oligoseptatum]
MADTKMQDIEVDKKPAIIDNDDVEADLKAGTISDLDEAEIFLRDHGIAHSPNANKVKAYCIGNIIGPHGFLGSEAPIYQTGCKLIIGCVAGQVLIALILRYVLIRRNKLRDAQGPVIEDENAALQDLTDFENPNFRYAY